MDIKHEGNRFYVRTPSGDAELLYRIEGSSMVIYRTFVPIEERHKGIAHEMTEHAVKYAEENKLTVIPACEYADAYMKKKDG